MHWVKIQTLLSYFQFSYRSEISCINKILIHPVLDEYENNWMMTYHYLLITTFNVIWIIWLITSWCIWPNLDIDASKLCPSTHSMSQLIKCGTYSVIIFKIARSACQKGASTICILLCVKYTLVRHVTVIKVQINILKKISVFAFWSMQPVTCLSCSVFFHILYIFCYSQYLTCNTS